MAVKPGYFLENTCLLVIQRVFGAHRIFVTQQEYGFYLELIKRYKEMYQVRIFAFCLFPASIYLVIGAGDLKAAGDFLKAINQTYCGSVALRDYARSCLQIQRSRVLVIEDEASLFDLVAVVETFPVKRGIVQRDEDYRWSSFFLRLQNDHDLLLEVWDPPVSLSHRPDGMSGNAV